MGGGDLLSHTKKCSTIGAKQFNFSVRNGKRWNQLAITAIYQIEYYILSYIGYAKSTSKILTEALRTHNI